MKIIYKHLLKNCLLEVWYTYEADNRFKLMVLQMSCCYANIVLQKEALLYGEEREVVIEEMELFEKKYSKSNADDNYLNMVIINIRMQ